MRLFRQCFNPNGAIEASTGQPTEIIERDGNRFISGYGGVNYDPSNPGTEYHLFLDAYERFTPEAWESAMRQTRPVECRFNHSADYVLGTTSNGTLTLRTDAKGIYYEQRFDSSDPDHNKVASKLASGLIGGSSVGFWVTRAEWQTEGNKDIFLIQEIELRDLGPVGTPAYSATGKPAIRGASDDMVKLRAHYESWKRFQRLEKLK